MECGLNVIVGESTSPSIIPLTCCEATQKQFASGTIQKGNVHQVQMSRHNICGKNLKNAYPVLVWAQVQF